MLLTFCSTITFWPWHLALIWHTHSAQSISPFLWYVTRWWSHLQRSKHPHFSWRFWPLKIRPPCSLKILGTNHPVMGPHIPGQQTSTAPLKKPKTSQHIQSPCYLTATGCHLLSESSLTKPTQLTAHTHGTVAAAHDKWQLLDTIRTRREETRFSTLKKWLLV